MSETNKSEPAVLPGAQISAIRMRVAALQEKAKRTAQVVQEIANELDDLWYILAIEVPGSGSLKRADGRLNDEGIRNIEAAFKSGMSVSEAAKNFGISISAASSRRKVWLAAWNATKAAEADAKRRIAEVEAVAARETAVAKEATEILEAAKVNADRWVDTVLKGGSTKPETAATQAGQPRKPTARKTTDTSSKPKRPRKTKSSSSPNGDTSST